jgi:hypothetical protein
MGWGRSDARQEFPAMRAADITWPMNRAGVYQARLFFSTSKIRYILSAFSIAGDSSRFLLWKRLKAVDFDSGGVSAEHPKYKKGHMLWDAHACGRRPDMRSTDLVLAEARRPDGSQYSCFLNPDDR